MKMYLRGEAGFVVVRCKG